MRRLFTVVFGVVMTLVVATAVVSFRKGPVEPQRPPSGGNTQFIAVEPNVELEVIDFGGTGRPLVLLAGHGATAHVFAEFSSKLTTKYHVYAITRRGFGFSSAPMTGYSAERLGDDVVAVLDALKLVRPILVGHSMAGEELSSVATFHSQRIAGLVYLDAAGPYALYDQVHGSLPMRLAALAGAIEPLIPRAFESITLAIFAGQQKFTELHVPILAIFADPHDLRPKIKDPARLSKAESLDRRRTERQMEAFQRQVPSARIVGIPYASHVIYASNETEVLGEINSFADSLP